MRDTNNSVLAVKKAKEHKGDVQGRKAVAISVFTIIAGFLLPHVTAGGKVTSFGVGFAAAIHSPISIVVFLSTFIGYLLTDVSSSLHYLAALITVIGLRWAVSGFSSVIRSRYFSPTLSFISTLITGSALLLTVSRTFFDVLQVVSESFLAAGFSYFTQLFYKETLEQGKGTIHKGMKLGTIVVACVVCTAFYSIEIGGISLGRMISPLFIVIAARCAGIRGGSIVGIVMGLMAFLQDPSQYYLASLYAFGGLLVGLVSDKKSFVGPLLFLGVYVVVFLSVDTTLDLKFVIGMYELVAAMVISFLIPSRIQRQFGNWLSEETMFDTISGSRKAVALKMKKAADTMSEVAGAVDEVSRELALIGAPNLGSMYRSVTDACCEKCKKRVSCWESHFSEIMDSFNHITSCLNQGETVVPESFDGYLKEYCVNLEDISKCVNEHYHEFLVREAAFRRLYELRGIINDQFENTGRILWEFANEFEKSEWSDFDSADRIAKNLKKEGFSVEEVLCKIKEDGHTEIEIGLCTSCSDKEVVLVREIVKDTCAREFVSPTVEQTQKQTRIYLSEGQVFRAAIGVAQVRCKGEELCGDAVEIFRDGSGNQFLILSDGMGSGGRAAVDGALTAGLTAEMLKAGFGYESILRIVNTALLATSNDETLATLDIACVNLFTGELELLKAGAGVSLLLSKDRISHIDDSSLPLGILRELSFARTRDRLVEGDVLVLMSDGISNDGVRWVEEVLRSFNIHEESMQSLSGRIIEIAQKIHNNDKGDDMTVIALKLEKAQ